MAIVVKRPPEPLCSAPFASLNEEPIIAGSRALDTLRRVLLRYCRRQIGGRSVLIAGHRGAGKTMLVKYVVDELRRSGLPVDARPLFIYLHGPDIVGGEDILGIEEEEASSGSEKSNTSATVNFYARRSEPEKEIPPGEKEDPGAVTKEHKRMGLIALRHMTVALQQAFVTHLGWAMQKRARGPDAAELATQFRLDLDRQLENSELRWYWDKAGVLQSGVLRETFDPRSDYGAPQGLLEIAALASINDAYTRATAKNVEESEGEILEAKLELKQERLEDRK